jgi:hypothetical protein
MTYRDGIAAAQRSFIITLLAPRFITGFHQAGSDAVGGGEILD